MADFPILVRFSHDESAIHRLQPQEMDALGVEVARAFQRCAVPESQLPGFEREQTERMMRIVCTISNVLSDRSENCARDGALRMLFLKNIITPPNLQNLFRMCDPNVRTGSVRCGAIFVTHLFAENTSTWNLQIPGDGPGNPPCSFGKKQITVMVKALTQKGFCQQPGACNCLESIWWCVAGALEKVAESKSEPLDGMFELLNSVDWPVILQGNDAYISKKPFAIIFYDIMIFMSLHQWACRFLIAENPDSTTAKTFLREKLGSCHLLLHKMLRRIISGEIYAPLASSVGRSRLDEVEPVGVFFHRFLHCLVPVPLDRETKALARRARMALMETLRSVPAQDSQKQRIESFVHALAILQTPKELSDAEQWDLLYNAFLSPRSAASNSKKIKKLRKDVNKKIKAQNNLQDGEMCGNCFVLEKTLLEESNQSEKLLTCSRCKQMKYCSQECQVEHWKKAHRKQCKKVVGGKAGSSSKSKS